LACSIVKQLEGTAAQRHQTHPGVLGHSACGGGCIVRVVSADGACGRWRMSGVWGKGTQAQQVSLGMLVGRAWSRGLGRVVICRCLRGVTSGVRYTCSACANFARVCRRPCCRRWNGIKHPTRFDCPNMCGRCPMRSSTRLSQRRTLVRAKCTVRCVSDPICTWPRCGGRHRRKES
jgi:hypothetical protein